MTKTIPVPVGISRIPEEVGNGRLRNLLLLIDNLDGPVPSSDEDRKRRIDFPMRTKDVIFVYVVSGEVELDINLSPIKANAGQVLTIMPNSVFQFCSDRNHQDMKYFSFSMNVQMFADLLEALNLHMPLIDRYSRHYQTSVDEETLQMSLEMYRTIQKELCAPEYRARDMVVQRLCEIMFLKCGSRLRTSMEPDVYHGTPKRKIQIYRDFLNMLDADYRTHREIYYYAEKLCITPKYLSTVVKEVSGKHASRWIDDFVAMEARVLLRQEKMSIREISDYLNFPTQSMFGRFFKKNTGCTPRDYRKL